MQMLLLFSAGSILKKSGRPGNLFEGEQQRVVIFTGAGQKPQTKPQAVFFEESTASQDITLAGKVLAATRTLSVVKA